MRAAPGAPGLQISAFPSEASCRLGLTVTAPDGGTAGEKAADAAPRSIAASHYESDPTPAAGAPAAVLWIAPAAPGRYVVHVLGRAAGRYRLELRGTDQDGLSSVVTLSGQAAHHSNDTFIVIYSGAPGTPVRASRARPGAVESHLYRDLS